VTQLPTVAVARWTGAFLIVGSAVAQAQIAGAAGVGASLQRQGGGFWQSLTRIEPAAKVVNPWVQLGGTASFVGGDRKMELESGSMDLVAESPVWKRWRVSTSAQIERHEALRGFPNSGGAAEAALSYSVGGRGAWMGLGSERSLKLAGSPVSNDGDGLLRFGLWQQLGPVSVVLGTSKHQSREQTFLKVRNPAQPDSLLGADSILAPNGSALRRWSDTKARVLWSFGRVALDGQIGVQSLDSVRTSMWGRATATVAMGSRVSFVGSFGTAPARAWMGVPGSRFASLGVRLAPAALSRPAAPPHVLPAPSRFAIHPAEGGTYTVTISVPAARTVELSGDFNSWRPVSLRETRPDVWEATIAIAPGTYHVNMRVNGASWVTPPGLSETSDDFNGTVGLLVVR
jgi:hypothetical protein